MKNIAVAILTLAFISIGSTTWAQSARPDESRTAVLENRLVRDSSGCPIAIELWLVSTTDTIQGLEAILQWDRPDRVEFVRGSAKFKPAPSATDSLTAMLKPTDPSTQMPVDRQGSKISGWEFVEARSTNGISAKILAVAKLFGQDEPEPLLPGSSGLLLRMPISVSDGSDLASDTGSVSLNFDGLNTRLSTHRGVLFGPLTLNTVAVQPADCRQKKIR